MADLVSPGVSVTVTNESFYAAAPVGTVPLIVIATAQDKLQTGTTNVAEGTLKANAGKLELMTSQRDLLQFYGSPNFVTVGGTPQFDNQINEVGLFTAYEFLGIANNAYVIRADVDLAELEPSTTAPTGIPSNNSYWMETGSTWGVFQSDGNVNPAFAWKAKTPLVLNSLTNLEIIVQGSAATPITQADTPVFASNATMVINGISLALNTTQSITDVVNVINGDTSLNLLQISAEVVARNQVTSNTTVQTVYSLRVQCADITDTIDFTGSATVQVLDVLGLTEEPINLVVPKNTVGSVGDFAITTLAQDQDGGYRNRMFEKIAITSGLGTNTSVENYWFPVGTRDSSVVNSGNVMAGWGWQESRPTRIIGSVSNPTFTSNVSAQIEVGTSATLQVGTQGSMGNPGTLSSLIANINATFTTANLNANADIYTTGLSSYLRITNYDGTDIWVHDTSNTAPMWSNVGINTRQTYFGSVVSSANPTFTANNQFTIDIGGGAKTVVVPASPGNTLANVVVAINTAVGATVATATGNLLSIDRAGTYITLQELVGTPLNSVGIDVGFTYGPQAFYNDYYPALAVPNTNNKLAANSVWINTTSQNRGVDISVRRYINGAWVRQNTNPNTGIIPWYSSTAVADSAFGAGKTTGTIFAYYNSDNSAPIQINMQLVRWSGTAWLPLSYTPSATAPRQGAPADGALWYTTQLKVDIMVNAGNQWKGYRNVYPGTDPNGILISNLAPGEQSTGIPLVDYDIWLDTGTEDYPTLKRYVASSGIWEQVDNTDQTSPAGILFLDARSNAGSGYNDSTRPSAMLESDNVDTDAPNPALYPTGMLLFNTRYSTNNVKVWRPDHFGLGQGTWVTASGNRIDGSPYMGSQAQRRMIVTAIQSALVSNEDARAEQTFFNLIAAPGYPECIEEMIALNIDKKEVAFVIGDTPSNLRPSPGTEIVNWATNANNVAETGDLGLTASSDYAAVWYPWALSTNLDGNSVFVPPSMMALRTIAFNDQVAYPWFAPAGFNRGLVTGVSSVGYLTSEGEYQPVKLNQGQRDVLYDNRINPIAFIPNRGLVIYGQKTLTATGPSALDRINVARLICYLRYQLDNVAKVYLFEPNDKQTRDAVLATFNNFFNNLVGLRAIFDYAVVCDESNNTAPRIDANQLWIDIAIKPTKAIEFIYIPIRILNTDDPLPNGVRS